MNQYNETMIREAVIYCRVSSTKQVTQGDGLNSQDTRCREYAKYKGYQVIKTFSDDMSESLTTRPGMQAMLQFLRKRKKFGTVVIIDDISRLARGIDAHLKLRAKLSEAGAKLESPPIEFGEDSDSQLVEHMLASVSQHQRQKTGEQTINRMRAHSLGGNRCFQAPIGNQYVRRPGHGMSLMQRFCRKRSKALQQAGSKLRSRSNAFWRDFRNFPKTLSQAKYETSASRIG